MNLLDHHISDGVMTITMNDIDRRNALSREMLDELVTTFDEACSADHLRPVRKVRTNCEPTDVVTTHGEPPATLTPLPLETRAMPAHSTPRRARL